MRLIALACLFPRKGQSNLNAKRYASKYSENGSHGRIKAHNLIAKRNQTL